MSDKPSTTLTATVEKIVKSPSPSVPEKVQIAVEGADHLYRELRIENTLTDENGDKYGSSKAPRWKSPLKRSQAQRYRRKVVRAQKRPVHNRLPCILKYLPASCGLIPKFFPTR